MSEAVAPESQPAAVGEVLPEATATPAEPASAPKPESDADKNWRALREQTDYWRDRAYQLEREREAANRQPERRETVPENPKTLADFDYDEARYTAYSGEQAAQLAELRGREAARQELARERAEQAQRTARAAFNERQASFAKDTPDYHEVISNPRFTQSEALLGELMASEEGPALAYHLAKNLNEANRFNSMSPVEVARAVTRLESKMIAEREKAKEARNQITSQPTPAPKLEGGEGSGATVKPDSSDSDSLSDAEWARRRNAQVRARDARR